MPARNPFVNPIKEAEIHIGGWLIWALDAKDDIAGNFDPEWGEPRTQILQLNQPARYGPAGCAAWQNDEVLGQTRFSVNLFPCNRQSLLNGLIELRRRAFLCQFGGNYTEQAIFFNLDRRLLIRTGLI